MSVNGWTEAPLGDCVEILDRKRIPLNRTERENRIAGKEEADLIPYFGATGQVGFIDDFIFDKEIVLLGEDGAPFHDRSKHKAYIVRGKSWVNNHAHVLVAHDGVTTNPFLKHYLDHFDYHGYVTGTTRLKLNQGALKTIPIPLPPLPEQRRIVARIEELFSHLDAGVAALRHAKAQLQRYRQSVLSAAVTGQLTQAWRNQHPDTEPAEELLNRILVRRRDQWNGKGSYKEPSPAEVTDLPTLPCTWSWATAEAISDQNRAITYGVIKLGRDFDGGVPTLRSSDVRPLRLELDHVKLVDPLIAANYGRTLLQGGELLVTVRGTLGGICVVPKECEGFNISREVSMIALLLPDVGRCLALMIGSQQLQTWMQRRAKGVTYRGVNIETLKRLPIPLPPLTEQHQIVAEVETRTTAIDHLEAELDRQITRSNHLRQSTLAAAFNGDL